MKMVEALRKLQAQSIKGRYVYTTGDLARLFAEPRRTPRLNASLGRLVAEGVLSRPTRGVYVYAENPGPEVLHHIVEAMRKGATNVESFETALSKWGLISQSYPRLLTVATTGREATVKTEWGTIELVHTAMAPTDLLAASVSRDGMLPLADEETSLLMARRASRKALELVEEEDDR